MKKLLSFSLVAVLLITLSSCGLLVPNVETMTGWKFQYNEGTDDYSLFFGLLDANDNPVAAAANVEIRIINDYDEVVYTGTKTITEDDFGTYSNLLQGDRFMANVRIDASELTEGASTCGTVYFTVSNSSSFMFDEASCKALYCLPIKDVQLNIPSLPLEIQNSSSYYGLESTVSITNISYAMDKSAFMPSLKITITGEKTFEGKSTVLGTIINYKLLDQEGFVVDSGRVYLNSDLSVGDKFKDDSLVIYDITPGETYTLQLTNSD